MGGASRLLTNVMLKKQAGCTKIETFAQEANSTGGTEPGGHFISLANLTSVRELQQNIFLK